MAMQGDLEKLRAKTQANRSRLGASTKPVQRQPTTASAPASSLGKKKKVRTKPSDQPPALTTKSHPSALTSKLTSDAQVNSLFIIIPGTSELAYPPSLTKEQLAATNAALMFQTHFLGSVLLF
jgi:hypothetical protein